MLARNKRRVVSLVLAIAPLALLALPGVVSANEREHSQVRTGAYEGVWHTDRVQIILTRVNRDGSFVGELRFDPRGRWGDRRTGITGRQLPNGSITVTRNDCPQTARTRPPQRKGGSLVWEGEVNFEPRVTSNFELRIPMRR
jgi:hypothetical protein